MPCVSSNSSVNYACVLCVTMFHGFSSQDWDLSRQTNSQGTVFQQSFPGTESQRN